MDNSYSPPVSNDFRQPENIIKPSKMQRFMRIVLGSMSMLFFMAINGAIYMFFVNGIIEKNILSYENLYFTWYNFYMFFLGLLVVSGVQCLILSVVLEFTIEKYYKKIYSIIGGFLIGISICFVFYILTMSDIIIILFILLIINSILSSLITYFILNLHIKYYNKKNIQAT